MQCTNPTWRKIDPMKQSVIMRKKKNKSLSPHYRLTPCNICMACRINKATMWADRLCHELESWSESAFLTITYDNNNLPPNGSLEKNEIKLFIKRLRWHYEKPIKYYICGEYGPNTMRPHYHGIFFGIGTKDLKYFGYEAWQKKCSLQNFHTDICIPETIRYTTKYLHKKMPGKKGREEYEKLKIEPPFALMSKGLGKDWCEKNAEKLLQNKAIISEKGNFHTIPRYYRDKINITENDYDYPDEKIIFEKIANQDQRERNAIAASKLKGDKL